jgi:hypothetical protein
MSFVWPPPDHLPEHILDALRADALHRMGRGPALTFPQVEALVELTSWAFHAVPADDPRYEERLEGWARAVRERHERRSSTVG